MTDTATAAATYFDAWQARDFTRLRSVLDARGIAAGS
jgi:hypothetical protein